MCAKTQTCLEQDTWEKLSFKHSGAKVETANMKDQPPRKVQKLPRSLGPRKLTRVLPRQLAEVRAVVPIQVGIVHAADGPASVHLPRSVPVLLAANLSLRPAIADSGGVVADFITAKGPVVVVSFAVAEVVSLVVDGKGAAATVLVVSVAVAGVMGEGGIISDTAAAAVESLFFANRGICFGGKGGRTGDARTESERAGGSGKAALRGAAACATSWGC